MSFGLRLIFRKELAPQFSASYSPRHDLDYLKEHRFVLGSLDYSAIQLIPNLAKVLSNHDTYKVSEPSLAGASDLILAEGSGSHKSPDSFYESYQAGSMLFLVRISISSLGFHLATGWRGAIDTINTTRNAIDTIASDTAEALAGKLGVTQRDVRPPISVWGTLGGPDLVCLAEPTSSQHLAFLAHYVHRLRYLPLAVILGKEQLAKPYTKCHAFSAIQGNLIYTNPVDLAKRFDNKIHRDIEERSGLCYLSRFSVGPGHELSVISRIQNAAVGNNLSDVSISVGHRAISLKLNHLSDLILSIEAAWRPVDENAKACRSVDVSAIRTTFGLKKSEFEENCYEKDSECIPCHEVPALSKELLRTLEKLEVTFGRFGSKYLGPSHSVELLQIFQSLRAAILRNDRSSGMRDLLPFFDQLERALSTPDCWERLFSKYNSHVIGKEFGMLFNHLWRAIKNRVEYRAEPLDPAFPNTIEYGASKLVNAYTVAIWAATHTLTSIMPHNDHNDCATERFSAAVTTGSQDEVSVRCFIQELHSYFPKPLQALSDGEWNAPLLLLTISGRALLSPEITFVLCVHEVAELTEWCALPQWKILNKSINRWLRAIFAREITRVLEEKSRDYPMDDDGQSAVVLSIVEALYDEGTGQEVPEEKYHPIYFLKGLRGRLACINQLTLKRSWHNLGDNAAAYDAQIDPEWLETLLNITDINLTKLDRRLKILKMHLNECLPDTAMVITLYRLLNLTNIEELIPHINYLYLSVIENSAPVKKTTEERHIRTMVERWVVQLATVYCASSTGNFQAAITKEIVQYSVLINRFTTKDNYNISEIVAGVFKKQEDGYDFFSDVSGEVTYAAAAAAFFKNGCAEIPYATSGPLKEIAEDFRTLWNKASEVDLMAGEVDEDVEVLRYKFIQNMWAHAQKLWHPIFSDNEIND